MSNSGCRPSASSWIEKGGWSRPPWIEPARSAAVRFCEEPTATMLTSLFGSMPSFARPTRVAMSDVEPGLLTPTFLPRRSFSVFTSAVAMKTYG